MVLSVKVYVEHDDLALAHTIRSVPDVDIGVVSDAGTDPEHDVYFFWIAAPDFAAVEEALAADHTVADFTLIVETDDRRTYRIEYSDAAKLLTPGIVKVGGITEESRSHLNGWRLHLKLQDHDALFALDEWADEQGIRLDVLELQQREVTEDRPEFGLTESQREALVGAFVQGYYDEPRTASLEELAALLDISPTAVSGRLRRGSARLIEAVLLDDDPENAR